MDEDSEAIVKEFLRLNEKSKEKFLQIGSLPRSGYKKWQPYFDSAFAIFTELWRFQQQHRETLSDNQVLKRHHIGEIASKIGQLYYQYYLRTSNTAYLTETYCFYYAIRCRGYYNNAKTEKRPEFMVKKLRYLCRFILVCLVLENVKLANEIFDDLSADIAEYSSAYQPYDSAWWTKVAEEIRRMLNSTGRHRLLDAGGQRLFVKHRLCEDNCPPLSHFNPAKSRWPDLRLADAIIVGNCCEQIKFSELSVDMLRMSLTLERQPGKADSKRGGGGGADSDEENRNPHKYLLYKPSLPEIVFSLNSCVNDLPNNGAVLVYFSADGRRGQVRKRRDDGGYKEGGVALNRAATDRLKFDRRQQHSGQSVKETKCFYPGDLYCFTRRPMFIIVDSDNSVAFKKLPNLFGEPLVCLMSPEVTPAAICPEGRQQGSLFTLFLHSPLSAMALICGAAEVELKAWERGAALVDRFLVEAGKLLLQSRDIDPSYHRFFADDFLRTILLRFLLCCVTLRLHKECRDPSCYPSCQPVIPQHLFDQQQLQDTVREVAGLMQAGEIFCEPADYSRN